MEEIPFCERNVRRWVILLIALAVFVLVFSIWSAKSSGRFRESGPSRRTSQKAAGTPAPAAQQVALTKTYSQSASSGDVAYQYPVDAVTRATPMGGIQFIAGTQATIQTANLSTAFNRAADIIRPCVVNINAIRPASFALPAANPNTPRFIDPFDGVPDKLVGRMAYESVGSGVIVDSSGYVVTNHHVVAGATAIVVTRFQHTEGHIPARIIASDPGSDLALLQILGEGPFPVVTLADSSRVEVGDWVLAVGNPFGLEHTVTAGIISGKRSSLVIGGVNYQGLLQTDASINKGSSGGPLVNLDGQVIGINTAIYAPTGAFNGTGFAIPSNRVGAFVARFMESDKVAVAMQGPGNPDATWLGIGVIDMTPDLAAKLSYPHSGGVYVSSLVLDSPADEAEITRGDIIVSVAGRPVQNTASLRRILAGFSPGQRVPVTIWRSGKTETLSLRTKVGQTAGG